MTAVIMICFHTLNYNALPDAEFFTGARCVSRIMRCTRHMRQWDIEQYRADELCISIEERRS